MCLLEGPASPAALHNLSTVEDLCPIRTSMGSCLPLKSMPGHCSICRPCNLSDSNLKHAGPAARCPAVCSWPGTLLTEENQVVLLSGMGIIPWCCTGAVPRPGGRRAHRRQQQSYRRKYWAAGQPALPRHRPAAAACPQSAASAREPAQASFLLTFVS